MYTRIAKALAYYKAPVKTFALLHPVKALKVAGLVSVATWLIGRERNRRGRKAGAS